MICKHPHHSPADTWKTLFDAREEADKSEASHSATFFRPSQTAAHLEILRLLKENEPNTIVSISLPFLDT